MNNNNHNNNNDNYNNDHGNHNLTFLIPLVVFSIMLEHIEINVSFHGVEYFLPN